MAKFTFNNKGKNKYPVVFIENLFGITNATFKNIKGKKYKVIQVVDSTGKLI